MAGNNMALLLIFGIVVILVALALAFTIRRMRGPKDDYADDDDIFSDRFNNSQAIDVSHDPFGGGGFDNAAGYASDNGAETAASEMPPEAEPEPVKEDPAPVFVEPVVASPPEEESLRNVVPLRAPEPEPQRRADPAPMQRQDEQPMRREAAFQSSAPQEPASGTYDYDYGAAGAGGFSQPGAAGSGSDWASSGSDSAPTASGRGTLDDDGQPFVAPFIRDYIEESERRQSSRLDDVRDDVRRQLSSIRDEQSSRLDLFLSSLDRKLSRSGDRASTEDGASTRRRIDSLADNLDRMGQSLERHGERLASMNRSVEEQLAEVKPVRSDLRTVHEDVLSFRRDVEANTLAIGQLRDDFDALKEDFGRMERHFLERAEADQGITMRVSDVIRGALEEGEYTIGARLSNGHRADAIIHLADGSARVAVDSRFPMESFNKLPSRDAVRRNMKHAKAAEDDFRRTVLRSIFACADRCIVDGETTDSAILFLPSEAAYTILHDRFPDLVRDSHRARVWLTSPSTLMGTLALVQNVFDRSETYEPSASYRSTRHDDEQPYYSGPEDQSYDHSADRRTASYAGADTKTSDLEERLRALRDEELALQDELASLRREPAPRPSPSPRPRRYRSVRADEGDGSDFEARLNRFSLDIGDDDRRSDDYVASERPSRSDRDDDLR